MDLRFLALGALAYGSSMFLWFSAWGMNVPALQLVGPLGLATIIGVALSLLGLAARGRPEYLKSGLIAIIGLVLMILGFAEVATSNLSYQFILGVCNFSMMVPSDSGSKWACPQVQASYQILWFSGIGLIVPVVLLLVVPSVQYLQRRPGVTDMS